MAHSPQFLNPSEAAKRLGVSPKALRLYEQRGLVTPIRTAAGWRAYGPAQMARAGEIAALRTLGFSLAQIGRIFGGDRSGLEQALAAHEAALEGKQKQIAAMAEKARRLRDDLAKGAALDAADLARQLAPAGEVIAAFDLPWPWGGERFELRGSHALTYIIGSLGSGKTRFAQALAAALPNAVFLGLDRNAAPLATDAALAARVEQIIAWLIEDGATRSDALVALLAGLEADGPDAIVIDMIEQGLDEATQEALSAFLRRRGPHARPLFAMTRSSAMLDLAAMGPDEAILLCPANHSAPLRVQPYPGAPGYEAVALCLAPPDVRARTEGVIAMRPPAP